MDIGADPLADRIAVLRVALDVVSDDLPVDCARPELVVSADGFTATATAVFDDGWQHGRLAAEDGGCPAAAGYAMAEHVQESLMERDWKVWPVCPRHGRGVHARLDGFNAYWCCTALGGHIVTRIGELRAEQERFAARRRGRR
jgi:hypothetical protein